LQVECSLPISQNVIPPEVRDEGISRRSKQFPADRTLLDGFLNLRDQSWRSRLPVRLDGKNASQNIPTIHFGPIASGDKVVASRAEADKIRALQSNAIAIEMESAGVASAAFSALKKVGFITVRSIYGFADNAKHDNWQNYSASAAASCLRSFIESRPVAISEGAWPKPQPPLQKPNPFEVRKKLFEELCNAVDMEDFKNFCFLLGVDIDELPGEKKSSRVRELILLFERRKQLSLLMPAFTEFRSNNKE
jgi:hypothetical protein